MTLDEVQFKMTEMEDKATAAGDREHREVISDHFILVRFRPQHEPRFAYWVGGQRRPREFVEGLLT